MGDRKSTRLNSSHTEIYTLSLHDALPISTSRSNVNTIKAGSRLANASPNSSTPAPSFSNSDYGRSEEHTSELQSHRDLHSFPTRRSSDLDVAIKRQHDKGRLTARERVAKLIDPGTEFFELGLW